MDFVKVLETELARRTATNSRYSLRAFARDLNIDQSSLSKVLARKRQLTNPSILRIANHLGLPARQAKKFLSVEQKAIKHAPLSDLNHEQFAIVANWYHDAILELIDTADFKPNLRWIAKRLALSEAQVRAAVQRLENVGYLQITKSGRWIDQSKDNSIHPDQVSSQTLKMYQKQILNNSLKAIDTVELSQRSHTSNTFSGSAENIEEARKLIEKCRRDVATLLGGSANTKNTEVYQIQISLFPITKPIQGENP